MLPCPLTRHRFFQLNKHQRVWRENFCGFPLALWTNYAFVLPRSRIQWCRGFAQEKTFDGEETGEVGKTLTPVSGVKDASTVWIERLESLLPCEFPFHARHACNDVLHPEETRQAITRMLTTARQQCPGSNILAELGLKQGRWSAVRHVIQLLASGTANRSDHRGSDSMPSNIEWPSAVSLEDSSTRPIALQEADSNPLSTKFDEATSPEGSPSACEGRSLHHIWSAIGAILLSIANRPSEESAKARAWIIQIFADLYHLGIIPGHASTRNNIPYGSMAQRPPIWQRMFSEIFSDRLNSDRKALHRELSKTSGLGSFEAEGFSKQQTKEINTSSLSRPGWDVLLGFVLWCCVEGGHISAMTCIVEQMYHKTDRITQRGRSLPDSSHGDCQESLLSHLPHTDHMAILPEVILASVEFILSSGFAVSQVHDNDSHLRSALSTISKLLALFPRHALPTSYVDYLAVRLLQPTMCDFEAKYASLQDLATTLRPLRSQGASDQPISRIPSLQIGSVLAQSDTCIGVHHQALESLAVTGRVYPSVELFNFIQESVDQSKLRSINSFLTSYAAENEPQDCSFKEDYLLSHGQLSAQKLAALLDVLAEVQMTDLGQWLLYSMDVDGPSIPLKNYDQSSLSPSILRFASLTQDNPLINDVEFMVWRRGLKPPVTFLRSLTDCCMQLGKIESAQRSLDMLNDAKGGGGSLRNLATVMATIVRIEKSEVGPEERVHGILPPLISLLNDSLNGAFRGVVGDFRKVQVKDQQRGLVSLLRVAEAVSGSSISDYAKAWLPRLSQTNTVSLDARTFNILLAAVVETRGAKAGMILWDLFCELPRPPRDQSASWTQNGFDEAGGMQDFMPVKDSTKFPASSQRADTRQEIMKLDTKYEMDNTSEEVQLLKHENASLYEAPLLGPEDDAVMPHHAPEADISLSNSFNFADWIAESSSPLTYKTTEFAVGSRPSAVVPVVEPGFRTLAIIVRTALQEMRVAEAFEYCESLEGSHNTCGTPSQANMHILDTVIGEMQIIQLWALPLLRRFGLDDEAVAQEFDWKIGHPNELFSTKQLEAKYQAAKMEYESAKKGVLTRLSKLGIRNNFAGPQTGRTKGYMKGKHAQRVEPFRRKTAAFSKPIYAADPFKEVPRPA